MTKIVIVEFYQSHTEVIKSWVEMFTELGHEVSVFLMNGRKFKIFKSSVEYRPLEELREFDKDAVYLVNTTKIAVKEHPIWNQLKLHRKFLVFHNFQDYDYFRGQTPEIFSKRQNQRHPYDLHCEKSTVCVFLCPAIKRKLVGHSCKYIQVIPTYLEEPITLTSMNNYVVIGRIDFRIRKYDELLVSFSKFVDRKDWTCTIIGAKTREKDLRQLHLLINKYNLRDRVTVLSDCQTDRLQQILMDTTFLLPMVANGSYHTDTLSGTIPLSMSYGIPMILDHKLASVYGLTHAIIYPRCLLDVLDKSMKMTRNDLMKLRTRYIEWSHQHHQQNMMIWSKALTEFSSNS